MNINRPLPPHLTIYKPQLTSMFPISHRISGAFLAIVLVSPLLCPKIGLISVTYENFYQSSSNLPKLLIVIVVGLNALLAVCYHIFHGYITITK
nr:succinate dehydrogenase subunit 3 [Schisandra repanda]UXD79047.1 succinate dehydrogenase subunit 3 [Schisandra repanda]